MENSIFLKTYEGFYHEDDMAKEIAGFLDCSIERGELDSSQLNNLRNSGRADTSMFIKYILNEFPEQEAVEALSHYMKQEHGITVTAHKRSLFLTEKPLKEACLEWLMKNWKGLSVIDRKVDPDWKVLFKEDGARVAAFNTNTNKALVDYSNIWHFMAQIYRDVNREKEEIPWAVRIWLKEVYGFEADQVGSQISGTML